MMWTFFKCISYITHVGLGWVISLKNVLFLDSSESHTWHQTIIQLTTIQNRNTFETTKIVSTLEKLGQGNIGIFAQKLILIITQLSVNRLK